MKKVIKTVTFTEELFKRLNSEKKQTGISANSIIVMSVDEWLRKQAKKRPVIMEVEK